MKKMLRIFFCILTLTFLNPPTSFSQVINESFETADWITASTTTISTLSANTTGTGSINNGVWSYRAANMQTATTRASAKSMSFSASFNSYIITPILPSGVSEIRLWVRANGTSSTINIGVATNTTITANTGSVSSTAAGNGWFSSTYSTGTGANQLSNGGWVQITYTTNITSPAFVKIQRIANTFFIDDIEIYSPSASAPTTQASNITFTGVSATGMNINWTNGNGTSRAVFIKEGTQGSIASPVDGTTYTASADWNTKGTQLGTSEYYCIYNGNANSVSLNNLSGSTNYWVYVFEYNGSGVTSKYLVSPQTFNSQTTLTPVPPTSFRSKVLNGNWSDASSWEMSTDNESTWVDAITAPDFDNSIKISILANDTININSGTVTVDQLIIEPNAKLNITTGATLSVVNGIGTDVLVNGLLELNGTFASAASSTTIVNGTLENKINAASFSAGSGNITISAGGTYSVNGYTGGAQLTFTNVTFTNGIGASGSNLVIVGASICRLPATQNGNVFINTPTVGGTFLQTNPTTITGNLTIIATTGVNHAAGGTPRSLTVSGDLNIQGGRYEVAGSGTSGAGSSSLTVNGNINVSGGKFYLSNTIAGGTGTVNARANINYTGGVLGLMSNVSSGNLVLNGTTAQTINITSPDSTLTVQNLTISNSSGVNITGTSTLDAKGTVSFTVSNANFATNGLLKLKSTATSTARIADITNAGTNTGNTISGNIIQERFIPAKAARKWSFISSPVSQTLAAGWQQQIHLTGANTGTTPCTVDATTGFDVTALNNPSVFSYNASNTSGSRWVAATNTNATSTAAGTGYRVLVRGPRTGGCALLDGSSLVPTAVTLSSTGAISNAAKNLGSFSITYNNNLANNWVLVGNPYPSQISFSALRTTNSSKISNAYAIYNPESNSGVYTVWNGTSFIGGASIPNTTGDVLPSGAAFFVQSTGATDLSLDFEEAHKTSSADTIYQRNYNNQKQIRVHYQNSANTQLDEVLVTFSNDKSYNDIVSMNSGTNYITALKDNKGMVVQYRDENNITEDEVQLNVVSTVNGTYKLNFSQYELLQQTTAIYLKDKYTNTLTNINSLGTDGYSFTTDKNNAATSGADRFSLVFRGINPAVTTISNIKLFPNPANKQVTLQLPNTTVDEVYTVRITDISGKVQLQQKLAAGVQQLNINRLAAGNYVVELTDSKGNRSTEKLVKQ